MTSNSVPFPFHVSEINVTRSNPKTTKEYVATTLSGTFTDTTTEALDALELLDGEAYLAAVPPDQRETLSASIQLLDSRMRSYYPAPEGEPLLSTKVGALTSARRHAAAGSVVWT